MSRTLTPQKTPVAVGGGNKISAASDLEIFMSAALSMSWKLAIAVLVPIVGGYELDKHLGTTPVFTILGLVLTMVLCSIVMSKTLKPYMPDNNGGKK
jgi:F0F1-type ATP synthase assembly protein I